MTEITRILAALDAAPGRPATLATLVHVEGSSYRRPGARLLLLPDGTRVGSISGGCLDEDVLERALRVLETGEPELALYDTAEENDLLWGVGTGCEGTVQIFLERIPAERPDWVNVLRANQHNRRETTIEVAYASTQTRACGTRLLASRGASAIVGLGLFRESIPASPALLICGAGDDAQPLLRMAKETGWHVTIADTRPAYVAAKRFPQADRLLSGAIEEIVARLPIDARTFAVIMTHRFEDDSKFLRALLETDIRYVGQLGARKRTERLLAKLALDGFAPSPTILARLHAPVGLDLGGSAPETVALSILAEMHARLAGRTPGNLRDRMGPIHG
jgi:xanthine/CO dehydrogenase XdhC/CoxF family maturation factor